MIVQKWYLKKMGFVYSQDLDICWWIVDMVIVYDVLLLQIVVFVCDVDDFVDYGFCWFLQLFGLKYWVIMMVKYVVDEVMLVVGGGLYFLVNELFWLYCDVLVGVFYLFDFEFVYFMVVSVWFGLIVM